MQLNRRQFLKLSTAVAAVAIWPTLGYSQRPPALPIPTLLEAKHGQPLCLTMQMINWSFNGKNSVSAWGFNNGYLGPTVKVKNGDHIKLACTNQLAETVGFTISGLMMPAEIINSKNSLIAPKDSWFPVLPIKQAASTCWYHASTPKNMARHIYNGLAGMWIVEEKESDLNEKLPNRYGINDFPLILQDKEFDFTGIPEYQGEYKAGFQGTALLTNGVIEPFVQVNSQWIRLRLLNASNARHYTLSLTEAEPFYLIANDQGILPTPVMLKTIMLAPGERKEILINMAGVNSISLISDIKRPLSQRVRNFLNISDESAFFKVIKLKTDEATTLNTYTLPKQFVAEESINYTVQRVRHLQLNRNGTINNRSWSANRIDMQIPLNSQEYWMIKTDYPQAFYIQGAQFRVIKSDDKQVEHANMGWKDTLWINKSAELLIRFNQPSSNRTPFLYYSQNLELADAGAMGQFTVI